MCISHSIDEAIPLDVPVEMMPSLSSGIARIFETAMPSSRNFDGSE